MKNLLVFSVVKDFGTDYRLRFLTLRGRSLFQASVSWSDYGMFPYLQATMGSNGFFGFLFCLGKLGVCLDVLARAYDIDYYKNDDVDTGKEEVSSFMKQLPKWSREEDD